MTNLIDNGNIDFRGIMIEHPGRKLEEILKISGMSRKELAIRTDVTEKHISTVINGERNISTLFARKLNYVFPDAADWVSLQAQYDTEQLEIQEKNNISKEELSILKPLHEISDYLDEQGYIQNVAGDANKVIQLRSFLKISNLKLIPDIPCNAAYRAQLASNVKIDPYVLYAWQCLCEKETENISIKSALNIELLESKLSFIKHMMFNEINKGVQTLQDVFAECGIAFQVVKNFKGAPVQGFIRSTSDNKLLMCLTIRRKRADTFWFTLFHEIGHIIYHDYADRFVDFDSIDSSKEFRADKFAQDTLIDPALYREFIMNEGFKSWNEIEKFAVQVEVEPFIVLGRLQKDGFLDWSDHTNKLVYYQWAE